MVTSSAGRPSGAPAAPKHGRNTAARAGTVAAASASAATRALEDAASAHCTSSITTSSGARCAAFSSHSCSSRTSQARGLGQQRGLPHARWPGDEHNAATPGAETVQLTAARRSEAVGCAVWEAPGHRNLHPVRPAFCSAALRRASLVDRLSTAGDLGREHPEFSHSDTAACRRT